MKLKTIQGKILQKIKFEIKQGSALLRTIEIFVGYLVYKILRHRYGEETKIIVFRGATGDIYIQFLLLKAYLEQAHISSYVVVGDSERFEEIACLFRSDKTYPYSRIEIECLEAWFLFSGKYDRNIMIPFFWTYNNWFNRCRIRMNDRFTFMDTYILISFQLKTNGRKIYSLPKFEDTDRILHLYHNMEIKKGRTVWIAPEANSITELPVCFWNRIICTLKTMGFMVFVNCETPGVTANPQCP